MTYLLRLPTLILFTSLLALSTPALAQTEYKLAASDAQAGDDFGWSVSLSGDAALVGAPSKETAYVFRRTGDAWVEEAILTGASGELGWSASLDTDVALLGAPEVPVTGEEVGSAYVFRQVEDAWVEETVFAPADATSQFGYSVSVSGDVALVGDPDDNVNGAFSGSAYIFRRTTSGWEEEAMLTASDGQASDRFGRAVSVSGDVALIGAPGPLTAQEPGSAYLFRRVEEEWVEEAKLTASDAQVLDWFMMSVSVYGDVGLIGAPFDDEGRGAAYVFRQTGSGWVEEVKLTASDGEGEDAFGIAVSASEGLALIGASGDEAGSAYVFRQTESGWVEEVMLTASDGDDGDQLGWSVSLSGDAALIGAPNDSDSGLDSGSAYVFGLAGAVAGEDALAVPAAPVLAPNYPNPFSRTTALRFELSVPAHVRVSVYDLLGRRVATLVDARRPAGWHEVVLDASDLPSGIYVYRLTADGTTRQRRMLLVK